VTVLASPFVGVSNDALVLLRRAAPRRPLFVGLERGLPEGLSARDERLFRAFLQRYDRLVAVAGALSLERLCERIVTEHDYDLAVLARWDGRRRYANMRKLARLARSYEELRGRDVEGFVRFVRDQEEIGGRELEAVAEEEGAQAVRLLTIHAAKGLEFKVVIVADAGRDARPPGGDEILCLPDGRFGFRVVDPASGRRRGAFDYESVKAAERRAEAEERRRLYYVAMTRAVDRLIVSGAYDRGRAADDATPIGWVLGRLGARELEEAGPTVELEREGARMLVRVDRYEPAPAAPAGEDHPEQLLLFPAGDPAALPPPAPRLPPLVPPPEPPAYRVRRLSYSALALFERCSYRFYAERLAGLRPVERAAGAGDVGLAATELGDAVHAILERIDLARPVAPSDDDIARAVVDRYPAASAEELARVRAFVAAYCDSALAARIAALPDVRTERPFAFEHDGVLLHGRFDVLALGGHAFVADYKTNSLAEGPPEEIVESDYRLQRLVYALACFRAGAERVEIAYQFLERADAVVTRTFEPADVPALEAELSAAIARINAADFRPQPDEFVCRDCPVLDVVCAGPRLRGVWGAETAPVAAAV
jgi:ATP-dependent helicase/nuclease subunit A